MTEGTVFDPRVGAAAITAGVAFALWTLTQVLGLWLRVRERRALILKSARSLIADLETDRRIGAASTSQQMFETLVGKLRADPAFTPYVTYERLPDGSAMEMIERVSSLPSQFQAKIKEYLRLSNMVSNILEDMTGERFGRLTSIAKRLCCSVFRTEHLERPTLAHQRFKI